MKIDELFNNLGYYDCNYILSHGFTFILLVGARGTGKTYGMLEEILKREEMFIYLRRTATELDNAVNENCNPFDLYNAGIEVEIVAKGLKSFCINNKCIGYAAALTTFHNLRSVNTVNFEKVKIIIYDECIPESHVRGIKDEYGVLMNLYETVNRNRELKGIKPVTMVMISNSNNINHPVITGLGLADVLYNNKGIYIDNDRDLVVINAVNKKFKERKANTSLYKLTQNNKAFQKMALDNSFEGVKTDDIQHKISIKEYKFLIRFILNYNVYTILRHKSMSFLYITDKKFGVPNTIYNCDIEEERLYFLRKYCFLIDYRIGGKCKFNSLQTKITFDNLIKK